MTANQVVDTILSHKSIRKYTGETPSEEVIRTIIRAGQQAPFAYQYYSILISKNRKKNPFKAPILLTICIDSYKFELIMTKRNWKICSNDLSLLLFGIQDASLMAENIVIAARSLGLGSCFLGSAPYRADKIAEEYDLPPRVFPLVQLTIGYPDENPPPRPRYPVEFTLFENRYPKLRDQLVVKAMEQMDQGYLEQDYYRKANYRIPLEKKRKETFTFDDYSWTEHICRKVGQWFPKPNELLRQFEKRGFFIAKMRPKQR